ncbi:MAG: hypothetical protein CM15mP46_3200 [Alphaproteobacteria bacterium]|nr:MAG: hypothetical protein CM15mP46_3200 [Alphaproteobacteria bacterium]
MLMGTYEKATVNHGQKQTRHGNSDINFSNLILTWMLESLEVGFSHFPAFEKAGDK